MKIISVEMLDNLSRDAANSPRLRKNLNLHPEMADPVQRLFNAIEPGTYIRPHRHGKGDRWELLSMQRGRAILLVFDDDGKVIERQILAAAGPIPVVELPGGAWHSLVALEPGSIFLEIKQGPYIPVADEDFAAWAPKEGEAGSPELLTWFTQASIGDTPPSR